MIQGKKFEKISVELVIFNNKSEFKYNEIVKTDELGTPVYDHLIGKIEPLLNTTF